MYNFCDYFSYYESEFQSKCRLAQWKTHPQMNLEVPSLKCTCWPDTLWPCCWACGRDSCSFTPSLRGRHTRRRSLKTKYFIQWTTEKKFPNILSSKTPKNNITSLFLNTENVKGPYKWRVLSIYFLLEYSLDVCS